MGNGTCSMECCGRPVYGRGWCKMHYQRWTRTGSPDGGKPVIPLDVKLWKRVDRSDPVACWIWQGSTLRSGYGQIWDPDLKRLRYVHRVAYELTLGPIADDLVIDHLCRVRNCCNPAHLEVVTTRENIIRGVAPSAVNARKAACVNGHPLEGANLGTWKDRRFCRTCRRDRDRERARRTAAV